MPAYQSVAKFDLPRKYRMKAAGCEQCAQIASDPPTGQQWRELAAQWRSMASQAAQVIRDDSWSEFG
jgi:hypothetical protein